MSEIALPNTSSQYMSNYPTGSVMTNINSGVVPNVDSPSSTSPPVGYDDASQSQYQAYQDYAAYQQMSLTYPMSYPVSRFGYVDQRAHTASPDPISSSTAAHTSPTAAASVSAAATFSTQVLTTEPLDPTADPSQMMTPLVPSSTFSNATTERVKETIARANSVPMEFYHTEFLEYSKETYEKKLDAKRNKRKRPAPNASTSTGTTNTNNSINSSSASVSDDVGSHKKKRSSDSDRDDSDEDPDDEDVNGDTSISSAEMRRQIHIQSEQKRRAQIKDGFDELRMHLPGCSNKKMSKAALLTRTVQQIQHLKGMQTELLSEVERLVQENETLKKFQHGVLQRQAMEKMYTF